MRARDLGRRAVLFGVPAISLAAVVASSAVLAAELPVRVPSSWDGTSPPATMELASYTGLLALLVVTGAVLLDALRRRVGEPVSQRVLAALAVGVPAALAALHVGILLGLRAQEPPYELPLGALAVGAGVLLVVGALGAAVVRPEHRRGEPIEPKSLEIAEGEAVVWSGSSSAPTGGWVLLLGSMALAAALLFVADVLWAALLVAVLALIGSALLRVTVTVGPAGVSAALGPLGLLRFRAPLEDVSDVHAEVVDPLVYGGWGLRWLPGLRGVLLRPGPGLRVVRTGGPDLLVTVDGAAEAAGVLRAHLERGRRD